MGIVVEKARTGPDRADLLFAFGQLEGQTRELIRHADNLLNAPESEGRKDALADAIVRAERALCRIRNQAGIDDLKGEL